MHPDERAFLLARRLTNEVANLSGELLSRINLVYEERVNHFAVRMLLHRMPSTHEAPTMQPGSPPPLVTTGTFKEFGDARWRQPDDYQTPNAFIGEDGTQPISGVGDDELSKLVETAKGGAEDTAKGGVKPNTKSTQPNVPVTGVSWYDAAAYCLQSDVYGRLPTAQELRSVVGEVWEWSSSLFSETPTHVAVVRRGGDNVETIGINPDLRLPNVGFRVVRGHRRRDIGERFGGADGAMTPRRGVAVLNEHEEWQTKLCDQLSDRNIFSRQIHIHAARFDIHNDNFDDVELVVNRASPSAGRRGHASAVFFALQMIERFERLGIPVINGSNAYLLEISKARQYQLLKQLELPFPRTVVVNSPDHVLAAGRSFGDRPVILKPNVGGSGAGVERFNSGARIDRQRAAATLAASLDKTAVLQEYLEGDIYRVEWIGGKHLYSVKVTGGGWDKCPNQDCSSRASGDRNTVPNYSLCANRPGNPPAFTKHEEEQCVKDDVALVAKAGKLDVCGVEYMKVGNQRYYFDINALSNFVRDPEQILGKEFVDPTKQLVDYIELRLNDARRAGRRPQP